MSEDASREDASMRLQRWLALCGVASRRACEELITAGRVEVNGRVVTQLGTKVDPERDTVTVDGERVRAPARRFYVALHKPRGVVCTAEDPAGRPRAIDLVAEVPARLFPIGRLDEDSAGLLLLTNDGDFAQHVAHPRYEVPKVYRVVVKGEPDPAAIQKLRTGIWLAEGRTAPAHVRVLRQTRQFTTLAVTLHEGKNRELRRMLARVELPVTDLLRISIGPVRLGSLKRGQWRMLAPWEVQALLKGGAGARPPMPAAGASRPPRPARHRALKHPPRHPAPPRPARHHGRSRRGPQPGTSRRRR